MTGQWVTPLDDDWPETFKALMREQPLNRLAAFMFDPTGGTSRRASLLLQDNGDVRCMLKAEWTGPSVLHGVAPNFTVARAWAEAFLRHEINSKEEFTARILDDSMEDPVLDLDTVRRNLAQMFDEPVRHQMDASDDCIREFMSNAEDDLLRALRPERDEGIRRIVDDVSYAGAFPPQGGPAMVRCKLVCAKAGGGRLILRPVTAVKGASEENERFFQATPGGAIDLQVVNESALARFEVGKEYYADFHPVETADEVPDPALGSGAQGSGPTVAESDSDAANDAKDGSPE